MKSTLKKAIIFDCDNTLWKGIVGEGAIEHNSDIQQDIVFLANKGVIIGLCSKNNEQDVIDALKDEILTFDVISVYRINWKDKASNLKEIAEELNIGLDAIVFVDDSKFELGLIHKELPEVMTIHPEKLMECVTKNFDLTGDFTKTQQYKDNYKRAKYQEQFTDIDEYLNSLDMILRVRMNEYLHIYRIVELTNKTNQFNLTTKRYDYDQIEFLMKNNHVYSLAVQDKFGDNGVVGVCIVIGNQIDTFLLSCRVLGRKIEYAFMDYIIERELNLGQNVMFGRYVSSERNKQVENFYSNLDFECLDVSNKGVIFVKRLTEYEEKSTIKFRYE